MNENSNTNKIIINSEYFEISSLLQDYFSENHNLKGRAYQIICQIQGEENLTKLFDELEPYYLSSNLSHRNLILDIYLHFKGFSAYYLPRYINHKDRNIRKVTTELLITYKDKSLVNIILPLVDDQDTNVKYSAIEAIGKLGSQEHIPFLYDKLQVLPEYTCILLNAIGEIGGEQAETIILDKLKESEDVFAKMCALDAISKTGQTEETLYYLTEDIQNAEEVLYPVYLKAMFAIAKKLEIYFEVPEVIRPYIFNALTENDDEYISSALNLINGDIRLEDVHYFQSKFLISNSHLRDLLENNIINITEKEVYNELMSKLLGHIKELFSFEDFASEIQNKLKEYEIIGDYNFLERNLDFFVSFVLNNEDINSSLIISRLKLVFPNRINDVFGSQEANV